MGKVTPSNPSQNSFMRQSERKSSRTRSPRGRSPSVRTSRWPCKDYLRGTCNNSSCKRWHPPECLFYKNKNGCRFGEKCSFAHRQVDTQPTKWSKSNNDKSAVALLKKGDWHERGSVTDRSHDRSGKPDSDNLGTIIYLRALQGHSGSNLIDPTLQDNVLIGPGIFPYIYHVGSNFNLYSIINNGLVPGGQNLSRRQTVFFLPVDPRDESHKDPEY